MCFYFIASGLQGKIQAGLEDPGGLEPYHLKVFGFEVGQ